MKLFLALITVLGFTLMAAFPGQAQNKNSDPHPVCSTKDFAVFAVKYSELSADEQASCFGPGFDNDGDSEKLIISEADTRKNDQMPTNPFMGPPDTLDGGAEHYGYVIEDKGLNKKSMALTEGGTFTFQVVDFAWNGKSWQATGITKEGLHPE